MNNIYFCYAIDENGNYGYGLTYSTSENALEKAKTLLINNGVCGIGEIYYSYIGLPETLRYDDLEDLRVIVNYIVEQEGLVNFVKQNVNILTEIRC
jgi:hypothetical protein